MKVSDVKEAVKLHRQANGLTEDGHACPETLAAMFGAASTISESTKTRKTRTMENSSKNNKSNTLNEANMNISVNGDSAAEVAELMRIMQLSGAEGAKPVDMDDINPGPKPCPICGKMHGPSQPMGGCGSKPREPEGPEMGDMIRMMSREEEDMDGGFSDATTEPDEYTAANAGEVSDVIPSGDDLHKEKGSYPATAGGDNPMNTQESIREKLTQALAQKKNTVTERDVEDNFDVKHREINNMGRKMIDMSSSMSGTDDDSLMMANALSRLGEVLAEFGGSGFAANNMKDVTKKTGFSPEIVKMLMRKAKSE